jgi:hypothetical protein
VQVQMNERGGHADLPGAGAQLRAGGKGGQGLTTRSPGMARQAVTMVLLDHPQPFGDRAIFGVPRMAHTLQLLP